MTDCGQRMVRLPPREWSDYGRGRSDYIWQSDYIWHGEWSDYIWQSEDGQKMVRLPPENGQSTAELGQSTAGYTM